MTRDGLQQEALSEWLKFRRGLLVLPTGTGKSKIAIDAIKETKAKKVLIIVPTQNLRDHNWPLEFAKWKLNHKNIELVCYASIAKIKGRTYDLVIMDEAHRITENNKEFFYQNKVKDILGLTATNPKDKKELLDDICPLIYNIKLDKAISSNAVADYEIEMIFLPLDNKDKYIEAGNPKTRFYQTEEGKYAYINKVINKIRYSGKQVPDFFYMNRMRFLYNLKSKTIAAKQLLEDIQDVRTLIFCGSIDQAETICPQSFHSKSSDEHLQSFMQEKINHLSCVKALNEGINIPNVECAVIVQLNSKELDLVQRIGRTLRTDKGKAAKIYILVSAQTQDEVWAEKAIQYFDETKITRVWKKSKQL